MPFVNIHLLVAWGGTAPGNELWTNTLRMRFVNPGGEPSQSVVNGWLQDGMKDALATYWTAVKPFVGANTKLVWMKANRVGTNGKYIDATTNQYTWTSPVSGTAGYVPPNQSSIVVSTITSQARGRAHIGRFYLPSVGITLDTTAGTFSSTDATTIANASKTFLDGLNNATDLATVDQAKCAVMSKLGAGTTWDIIGARVGRTVDTQRRRRNKIPEVGVQSLI